MGVGLLSISFDKDQQLWKDIIDIELPMTLRSRVILEWPMHCYLWIGLSRISWLPIRRRQQCRPFLQEKQLKEKLEKLKLEKETLEKIAARIYAERNLSDLLPDTLNELTDNNYLYDPVERGE